jgi:FAD dependent oxidoreductase
MMNGRSNGNVSGCEVRISRPAWRVWPLPVLLWVMTVNIGWAETDQARAEQSTDVVVVGAGTGGVSAAIQAARLGAQVALLEETEWIGGQMTASADATMDEGNSGITLNSGLYAEFVQRMQAYYLARGKSVGTCYGRDTNHCYEPAVIQQILFEMIHDANDQSKGHVNVYLREKVVKVLGTDQVVSGVITQNHRVFHSKVVIDATEFGDVLPLTPAAYRIGHFTSAAPGKSCIQDIAYMPILKKYLNGVPPGLLMQHAPPGYDAEFVAYMRRFLRADGNPTGSQVPVNLDVHNRLRALPDLSNPDNYTASAPRNVSRTALNWFNDYPADTDLFDRAKRKSIMCAAKLRSLDVIYYIQHDLNGNLWSVANDQGYDTAYNREENSCPNIPHEFKPLEANFPPLPYIRESRRLIGEYTLIGEDVRREEAWPTSARFTDIPLWTIFSDSIAVGDYTVYLHDCKTDPDLEHDLDHVTDMPTEFRHGAFQVPIEVLIPERVNGLLAAEKNISESRIANSATRMQPITMLVGQAAGALAAIAVSQNIEARKVDPGLVQRAVLQFDSALSKRDLSDLPRNVDEWRAAEYALVHHWLPEAPQGFLPQPTLTRAEAANALVSAFQLLPPPNELQRRWGYQPSPNATFKDVPLYDKSSADVEVLAAAHAVRSCAKASDLFCPDDAETVADFVSSINTLQHRSDVQSTSAPNSANDAAGDQADAPLTRIQAALLLYHYLDPTRPSP